LPIPTLKVGALGTHKALGWPRRRARGSCSRRHPRSTATALSTRRRKLLGQRQPIGPRGRYDEAKRFAEAMTVAYPPVSRPRRQDRPDLQHLRTAHARQGRDARVPAFISQALRNEDVTVFGDGRQTRSFTYITDLVDGIIR
jgi:dTDP-glucose 4,6-dehydratase